MVGAAYTALVAKLLLNKSNNRGTARQAGEVRKGKKEGLVIMVSFD
jgi:hypothetical protein